MPRSNKPRKRYRPHGVNPTAHLMAMHGAALLTVDDRTVWAALLDDAITAVGRAQATEEQWEAIFDASALAEKGDWPICHHCGQMMHPEPLRREHE